MFENRFWIALHLLLLGYGGLAQRLEPDSLYSQFERLESDENSLQEWESVSPRMLSYENKGQDSLWIRIIDLFDDRAFKISQAQTLSDFGVYYWYNSKYEEGLDVLARAKEIFESEDYAKGIYNCLNRQGLILNSQGRVDLAQTKYLEAIELGENDDYFLTLVYSNIGIIYDDQGLRGEAIKYYKLVFEKAEEISRPDKKIIAAVNMAGAFYQSNEYDSGDYYSQVALSLAIEYENWGQQAAIYHSMGSSKLDREMLEEAFEFYKKAEEINLKTGSRSRLALNYQGLGAYYDRVGDKTGDQSMYEKSLEYFEKMLEITEETGQNKRLRYAYQKMYETHALLNNYEEAFNYFVKYDSLRNEFFDEEQSEQLLDLKEKYEAEKREQEIARQKAVLQTESTFRNALIGGVVFLVVIIGLVYRNQRVKGRALREKESLLKEIHHRVKNNLQVISSLLNMQSRETEDSEMQQVIQEGQSRVKAMALIHQKLYQTDSLSKIDFQDYIQQLSDQLTSLYKREGLVVDSQINANNIKLDIDTAIPLGLILNELISNAYKYAFADLNSGNITIDLKRIEGQKLELEVTDNGPGLPKDIDFKEVKSLGLKLVNILTQQLKGSLTHDRSSGTRFLIRFSELNMAHEQG